ncbi:MAG: aminotransferase class I/II-fold pyridoxal phosphate-dependent enzyme [Candidatus Bipolaricaulia bacterium]
MPLEKMESVASKALEALAKEGTLKGEEWVITEIQEPTDQKGPRYIIEGQEGQEFLRMNSNSYLGMSLKEELIKAEEETAERFGTGPGAVRFIHGTYKPHVALEEKLADFHDKETAMIFSSAYSTNCGILAPLISQDTVVMSDQLNHNSIIMAIRLARPQDKEIYQHLDMEDLGSKIKKWVGKCKRIMIATDGVFSMRGDYPDLAQLVALSQKYDSEFEEGIFTVVDDSHGIGAFGKTGRGTPEVTGGEAVDIITSTMGKALGVNGGYVVTQAKIIEYLRETSPFYVYSNPITPSEASAALQALEILDSDRGRSMLDALREKTRYFKSGLVDLGYETIKGEHPIVPVIIRDTQKTEKLVNYLKERGVLVAGLKFPVVPRGDESIRIQISADHTKQDLDYVLGVLKNYITVTRLEDG